jgi:nucleoside-diphosphate-sugar epimerase
VTNVLISGGAGFLGSHLAHNLAARDYRVTVLDNLSAQIHGENPPICGATERYTFLKGDVRSREDCRSTTWIIGTPDLSPAAPGTSGSIPVEQPEIGVQSGEVAG